MRGSIVVESNATRGQLHPYLACGLLCLGVCLGCAPTYAPAQREAGVIDISDWEPASDGMVRLDGQWSFFPNEFVSAKELINGQRRAKQFVSVPGVWDQVEVTESGGEKRLLGGNAFGTYHLRVILPRLDGIFAVRVQAALSAYDLWIDDQLVASMGKPGRHKDTTRALYAPRSALFFSSSQEISLVVHIANFHHRSGGLSRHILLGTDKQLILHERQQSMTDMFVLASIAVMAGYHLIHFFYRRQELTSLYFALGCIFVMLWQSCNNEYLLRELLPELSSEVGLRIDYCSFFGSVSFFALFVHAMFPAHFSRQLAWTVIVVAIAFTLVVLTSSMLVSSQVIPFFQAFTALTALVGILYLVRALWLGVPLAGYILVGIAVFVATYLHDILYSHGLLQTTWLSPFGLVFFVVVISMTISVRFRRSFNHVNQLKSAFEKFVPKRFLVRITDEDLSKFTLGNAHSESLVVLFSDIRGFTTISEQLSPADLLDYLNLYFLEMATVVKRNGGFIDKFIGDAVMALFDEYESGDQPSACARALQTSIEMQRALPELNARLKEKLWPPIRIGIGLHYGLVVMGTVGAEFRMDSTVLGDTVNTAARLESLTKLHEVSIILSQALLAQLPSDNDFNVHEIGTVSVQGKLQPVHIYSLEFTPKNGWR